jgi:hypothetical protein
MTNVTPFDRKNVQPAEDPILAEARALFSRIHDARTGIAVNDILIRRIKGLQQLQAQEFAKGDRIRWTGRLGPTSGTVQVTPRSGSRKVHVLADDGGRWSVSASLLSRVP